MNAADSIKPLCSVSSQLDGEKSEISGGIAKPKKPTKTRGGKSSDNPRRSQRNSQSVELFALYDPYGNANKHDASSERSTSSSLRDDKDSQLTDLQNLSPILSINGDYEGYQTPSFSPDDDSQNSDLHRMSVSPDHVVSNEMEIHQLYETPRAPLIRPVASPFDHFDFGLDLCHHRSRVDSTFTHLKLCFNKEIETTFLPPEQPNPSYVHANTTAAAASAQATPKRHEKNGCVLQ